MLAKIAKEHDNCKKQERTAVERQKSMYLIDKHKALCLQMSLTGAQ